MTCSNMLTNLLTCYVNIQTEALSLKVERFGGTFITQAMPPNGAKIMDFMWNGPVMVYKKNLTTYC